LYPSYSRSDIGLLAILRHDCRYFYSDFSYVTNHGNQLLRTFSNEADFTEATFSSNKGETLFKYIIFEQPNKVIFSKSNLSKVSFVGSDITKIRFGDKISWGWK
jgi:uncharacterized protein YjbI with pentapeptide repeats